MPVKPQIMPEGSSKGEDSSSWFARILHIFLLVAVIIGIQKLFGLIGGWLRPIKPAATAVHSSADSVVTRGYEDLGHAGFVRVEVTESRAASETLLRGLIINIDDHTCFVDESDVPKLLKACDTLMSVNANPTKFKNFMISQTVGDDLDLQVEYKQAVSNKLKFYIVLTEKARATLELQDMKKFRLLADQASNKLLSLGSAK